MAIIAALGFVALIGYGLVVKATDNSIDQSLANGTAPRAPNFQDSVLEPGVLPGVLRHGVRPPLAESQLSPTDLKGTPFVLNFWASWCTPCRAEAPILEAGWQRFGPQGVLFLGLDMQDLTGDARSFIDEFHLTYPHVREPSNDTARAYGVTGLPETFFVTAKGRVVGHVIGAISRPQLEQGVRAAKAGRLVGTENGGARRVVR